MPPVLGAVFLAALVASAFLGAFPPVDFFAVCLVRAILWSCASVSAFYRRLVQWLTVMSQWLTVMSQWLTVMSQWLTVMSQWFDDDDERNDFITSKYLARNVLKALQSASRPRSGMHRIVVGVLQENFEWIPHAAANVLDRSASLTAARTHEETFSHPAMRVAAAEDVASFTRPA
jgi:hypothetical protein